LWGFGFENFLDLDLENFLDLDQILVLGSFLDLDRPYLYLVPFFYLGDLVLDLVDMFLFHHDLVHPYLYLALQHLEFD
jgi:hypothetical protein